MTQTLGGPYPSTETLGIFLGFLVALEEADQLAATIAAEQTLAGQRLTFALGAQVEPVSLQLAEIAQ